MKKLLILTALLFGMFASAQNMKHRGTVQILDVPLGVVGDSLLVRGADQIIKYIPSSALISGSGIQLRNNSFLDTEWLSIAFADAGATDGGSMYLGADGWQFTGYEVGGLFAQVQANVGGIYYPNQAQITWRVWEGANVMGIDIHNLNGMIVTDAKFTKGLEYFADYSAQWTDGSIVDMRWVNLQLADYLPLTGGTLTGAVTFDANEAIYYQGSEAQIDNAFGGYNLVNAKYVNQVRYNAFNSGQYVPTTSDNFKTVVLSTGATSIDLNDNAGMVAGYRVRFINDTGLELPVTASTGEATNKPLRNLKEGETLSAEIFATNKWQVEYSADYINLYHEGETADVDISKGDVLIQTGLNNWTLATEANLVFVHYFYSFGIAVNTVLSGSTDLKVLYKGIAYTANTITEGSAVYLDANGGTKTILTPNGDDLTRLGQGLSLNTYSFDASTLFHIQYRGNNADTSANNFKTAEGANTLIPSGQVVNSINGFSIYHPYHTFPSGSNNSTAITVSTGFQRTNTVTSAGTTVTVTVPPYDVGGVNYTNFDNGAIFAFNQGGAGKIVFSEGAGVTINSRLGLRSSGKNSQMFLMYQYGNNWTLFGELEGMISGINVPSADHTIFISLNSALGTNYSLDSASALEAYLIQEIVPRGLCEIFINSVNKPVFLNDFGTQTEVGGVGWTTGTDLILRFYSRNGSDVVYSFETP